MYRLVFLVVCLIVSTVLSSPLPLYLSINDVTDSYENTSRNPSATEKANLNPSDSNNIDYNTLDESSTITSKNDLSGQETFYPIGGVWWGVRPPWGGGWWAGRPGWHGWHGPQWGGHWGGGHWGGGPWGGGPWGGGHWGGGHWGGGHWG